MQQKQPKQHDDYLLSQGRKHYEYARSAKTLESCLYWLERYYDTNTRHIQRIAKRKKLTRQQQAGLRRQLQKGK